jgi:hypothetical protein
VSPARENKPKFWTNETPLVEVVNKYLQTPRQLTLREVALIRGYLKQCIDSPDWSSGLHNAQVLTELRGNINRVTSAAHIRLWLTTAREIGIEPIRRYRPEHGCILGT